MDVYQVANGALATVFVSYMISIVFMFLSQFDKEDDEGYNNREFARTFLISSVMTFLLGTYCVYRVYMLNAVGQLPVAYKPWFHVVFILYTVVTYLLKKNFYEMRIIFGCYFCYFLILTIACFLVG